MHKNDLSSHRASRGFTAEAIAHARERYENSDETQDSIALDFNVTRRTLDRLAKQQGWKLRKDRAARDLPLSLKLGLEANQEMSMSGGKATAHDSQSLADRLEQAVEKELRKVEGLRSQFGAPSHRSIEAERTARTLATLTETLFKVRRLRSPETTNADAIDDELPTDADAFRNALAERIERFVRSRTHTSVSEGSEPAESASTPE